MYLPYYNSPAHRLQKNNEIGSAGHGYSWVPPGLPRAKVEEYMQKLPNHMVPRLNSSGEKYREKQLMVQLPRQDLSVSYCKHLRTAVERRIYDEFVNSRNEVALDIGHVSAQLEKTTVSVGCVWCRCSCVNLFVTSVA